MQLPQPIKYKVGDVLIHNGEERLIIAVTGYTAEIGYRNIDGYFSTPGWYTQDELDEYNVTLKSRAEDHTPDVRKTINPQITTSSYTNREQKEQFKNAPKMIPEKWEPKEEDLIWCLENGSDDITNREWKWFLKEDQRFYINLNLVFPTRELAMARFREIMGDTNKTT